MLSGMKESYKEGVSESTLTPCLADGVARRRSKRRQGHRRAGLLSFEKSCFRVPTSFDRWEGHTGVCVRSRVGVRPCVVEEPEHVEKQHAREPGDLWNVSI